ncbi:Short-chain dehydrogenase/reductas [Mycobacteroides abscessus]|nr:Short-chain dehydrogenase/reductas [Mycobacteroides abscessus]
MSDEVVVVIGVGGMGRVIARRQGIGKTLLLADHNQEALQAVVDELKADGHNVIGQRVDVSSRASVSGLAQAAAGLGRVAQVAHTAGLSPAQSPTAAILAVDLVGVALVVEEFGKIVTSGGAGVVIASMAGHMPYELTPSKNKNSAAPTPRTCYRCRMYRTSSIPQLRTKCPSVPITFAFGSPPGNGVCGEPASTR